MTTWALFRYVKPKEERNTVMKQLAPLSILLLVMVILTPYLARANGFAIYTDRTYFALHDETTQVATIHYENGNEKLLLAVKLDKLTDDSIIWIIHQKD